MVEDGGESITEAKRAGAKGAAEFGRRARAALVLAGAVLVAAGVLVGFLWIVGIGAGLSEPRRPTDLESALFACWALFGFLLVGTGIASILCGSRRRLWGVGALAAATALTLALCFILEPLADRSACEKFISKQRGYGEGWEIDTSCRDR
jgi:hypothetical protein